jgi:hypothetical protein
MPPGIGLQVSIGVTSTTTGTSSSKGRESRRPCVPVDEETLFAEGDPILDAAVEFLGGS